MKNEYYLNNKVLKRTSKNNIIPRILVFFCKFWKIFILLLPYFTIFFVLLLVCLKAFWDIFVYYSNNICICICCDFENEYYSYSYSFDFEKRILFVFVFVWFWKTNIIRICIRLILKNEYYLYSYSVDFVWKWKWISHCVNLKHN